MSDTSKAFSDSIRAARQRRGDAPMRGDLPDGAVSEAAREFNSWARGGGNPGTGPTVFDDAIDDAARPNRADTETSEAFSRWARGEGVVDDGEGA